MTMHSASVVFPICTCIHTHAYLFMSTYMYTDGYKYISHHCHETHGQLPGPLWSSERAPLQIHHICISWLLKLISRGQLNYYANPCILSTVSLIWICVYAYWEALISSSFNVSKAPDSFQRIILAVLTSLKCRSWFEKVLTSTICYFSLNNLHFKVNMAFIFEWISVCCQNWSQMSKKKDAGLLLNKNVFIYQRSIKGRVPFSSSRQLY